MPIWKTITFYHLVNVSIFLMVLLHNTVVLQFSSLTVSWFMSLLLLSVASRSVIHLKYDFRYEEYLFFQHLCKTNSFGMIKNICVIVKELTARCKTFWK